MTSPPRRPEPNLHLAVDLQQVVLPSLPAIGDSK